MNHAPQPTTPVPPRNVFLPPPDDGPWDVEAMVRAVPAGAEVRGMFLQGMVDACRGAGVAAPEGPSPIIAYKLYPLAHFIRMAAHAAAVVHPGMTPRRGLRELGKGAYSTLLQSVAGRVVFGVLGRNIEAAMRVAGNAYDIALTVGRARTVETSPQHAIIHLWEVYNHLESWQVGAFEGAMTHLGHPARVRVHMVKPTEAFFLCEW